MAIRGDNSRLTFDPVWIHLGAALRPGASVSLVRVLGFWPRRRTRPVQHPSPRLPGAALDVLTGAGCGVAARYVATRWPEGRSATSGSTD